VQGGWVEEDVMSWQDSCPNGEDVMCCLRHVWRQWLLSSIIIITSCFMSGACVLSTGVVTSCCMSGAGFAHWFAHLLLYVWGALAWHIAQLLPRHGGKHHGVGVIGIGGLPHSHDGVPWVQLLQHHLLQRTRVGTWGVGGKEQVV
jgi:hypothetical protein